MKRRARGWFEKTHVRVPNFDLEFAWNLRRQKGTTEKYPATTFLKARAATFGQPHYGGVHAVPCQSQRHRSADAQPPLRLWPPSQRFRRKRFELRRFTKAALRSPAALDRHYAQPGADSIRHQTARGNRHLDSPAERAFERVVACGRQLQRNPRRAGRDRRPDAARPGHFRERPRARSQTLRTISRRLARRIARKPARTRLSADRAREFEHRRQAGHDRDLQHLRQRRWARRAKLCDWHGFWCQSAR